MGWGRSHQKWAVERLRAQLEFENKERKNAEREMRSKSRR